MKTVLRNALLGAFLSLLAGSALASLGGFGRASGGVGAGGGGGGGRTLVFNCPSFGGAGCNSSSIQSTGEAAYSGSQILLTSSTQSHQAGGAFTLTKENIQAFTTDFTFQIPVAGGGIVFVIQTSNILVADANADGYGAYASQPGVEISDSVGIMFDTSAMNGQSYIGTTPSMTGLYLNGAPTVDNGNMAPPIDLNALGINLGAGHVMSAHVVYDGTDLTMLLTDTSTSVSTTLSWPVNIPGVVGGSTAWVGFTGGTPPSTTSGQVIDSWAWYSGYNTELSSPTLSPAPGSYATSQTVSLTCPSGATCYYTTNGRTPTAGSTQYTGPITVSSSEYIQAIAVESNFTNSYVAGGNYSIGTSGAPFVNFPSGFASNGGLIQTLGYASLSGSNIQLTDTAQPLEDGAACYVAPVNVQSFTWVITTKQNGSANGLSFVIKSPLPSSQDATNGTTRQAVDGGPYDLGYSQPYLGYSPTFASIAVSLNLFSPANSTGLFENGTEPSTGTSVSPVTLGGNAAITTTLTYSGTTLSESVTDGTNTYNTSYTSLNIPSVIGSNTGYICVAGSTGGQSATQLITAMTFHN